MCENIHGAEIAMFSKPNKAHARFTVTTLRGLNIYNLISIQCTAPQYIKLYDLDLNTQ